MRARGMQEPIAVDSTTAPGPPGARGAYTLNLPWRVRPLRRCALPGAAQMALLMPLHRSEMAVGWWAEDCSRVPERW
jgi:hypothetical protein